MFKASELDLLQHLLVDVPLTDSTQHLLQKQHTNLEAVLLRSRILRQVQQVGYVSICQEHMDAKTENDVAKAVTRRGITCVIIAHRLSTIRNSDCIMVLDQGRIIERGNHEELIQEGGKYYQLYTGKIQNA